MNISALLYLIAVIAFVLVTFGVTNDDVNILAAGLAFTAAGLLTSSAFDRRIG